MVSSSYTVRINIIPTIVLMFNSIIGLTLMGSWVIYPFRTFAIRRFCDETSWVSMSRATKRSLAALAPSSTWPQAVTSGYTDNSPFRYFDIRMIQYLDTPICDPRNSKAELICTRSFLHVTTDCTKRCFELMIFINPDRRSMISMNQRSRSFCDLTSRCSLDGGSRHSKSR